MKTETQEKLDAIAEASSKVFYSLCLGDLLYVLEDQFEPDELDKITSQMGTPEDIESFLGRKFEIDWVEELTNFIQVRYLEDY